MYYPQVLVQNVFSRFNYQNEWNLVIKQIMSTIINYKYKQIMSTIINYLSIYYQIELNLTPVFEQ